MGNTLSCVPRAKRHKGVPVGREASSPGVWRVGFVLHPQAFALTKALMVGEEALISSSVCKFDLEKEALRLSGGCSILWDHTGG